MLLESLVSRSAPPSSPNLLFSSSSPGTGSVPGPLCGGLIWVRSAQDPCSGPAPPVLAGPFAQIMRHTLTGWLISWKAGRCSCVQKGHRERWGGGEQTGGGKNAINGECDRERNTLILGGKVNEAIERCLNGTSGSEDVDYHVCVEDGRTKWLPSVGFHRYNDCFHLYFYSF